MTSALINGEQRQAVLLDAEPLEDVDKFKYLGPVRFLSPEIVTLRIPAQLVQRWLRWFGHAARRPEGELIKDLLLSTPPRTWCRPVEDVGNYNQG